MKATDLTVEPQKQKHDEEEDGPEGGQRHHGDSFWIGDKSQARTYMGTGEGEEGESMWLEKDSPASIYSP